MMELITIVVVNGTMERILCLTVYLTSCKNTIYNR